MIRDLSAHKKKFDEVITVLEQVQAGTHLLKRRGRKSMDKASREEVSARMKKYWAARKVAETPFTPLSEHELRQAMRAAQA
ncbi:MAG: hypothetical protein JO323_09865 [Acidobacteriia bacterium]|nr:hypothetical protein [Terriglobia bacterium]